MRHRTFFKNSLDIEEKRYDMKIESAQILRTSKQLYEEGMSILFAENQFSLHCTVELFCRGIGARAAARVKHITIQLGHGGPYEQSSSSLPGLTNLRSLRFALDLEFTYHHAVPAPPSADHGTLIPKPGLSLLPDRLPTLPPSAVKLFSEKKDLDVTFEVSILSSQDLCPVCSFFPRAPIYSTLGSRRFELSVYPRSPLFQIDIDNFLAMFDCQKCSNIDLKLMDFDWSR